jgi:peptide-methionine (S)-S-oxide reductase
MIEHGKIRMSGTVLLTGLLVIGGALLLIGRSHAERAHIIPPPVTDAPTGGDATEVAVLAGGCFWGVQGVFQHVDGVTGAVSGYAGGEPNTAQYETVGTGATGHAETVRVSFDPHRISYGRILQIYFSVAHDPTQLNRQGPDIGTQYRSTIFPANPRQTEIAKAYIAQLGEKHAFTAAIATTIEPGRTFYPAEAYHQDFLARHPRNAYIAAYDLPKLDELRRIFPDLYRADPVLVTASSLSN